MTEHGYDGLLPMHIIDANEVVQMSVRRKKSKMLLHLTKRSLSDPCMINSSFLSGSICLHNLSLLQITTGCGRVASDG